MKRAGIPRSERGAAMLAALCLATVFTICLTSFISLCYVSLYASSRNVMSARCYEIAEMGLEEAMYAQNYVSNGSVGDWSTDSWTTSGSNKTVTMIVTSSGLVNSTSNPTALNLGSGATGKVVITVNNYATSSPPSNQVTFKAQGIITYPVGLGHTNTISRTLTSGTSSAVAAPMFVNAAAAVGLNGGVTISNNTPATTVDSYNSAAGTYSSASSGYSAVLLSESGSVRLNNAVLHGYAVAANSSSVTYRNSALIRGINSSASTAIDTNQILAAAQPYQPSFNEIVPSTSAGTTLYQYFAQFVDSSTTTNITNSVVQIGTQSSAPTPALQISSSGTVNLTSGYSTLGNGNLANLPPISVQNSSNSNQGLYIGTSGGTSTVVVNVVGASAIPFLGTLPAQDIYLNGGNMIIAQPTVMIVNDAGGSKPAILITNNGVLQINSSLTLIVEGTSNLSTELDMTSGGAIKLAAGGSLQILLETGGITDSSTTGFVNASSLPKRLAIFAGNNSNSGGATITISQTANNFYGVIYAPNHSITLSMGGDAFFGSVVGNSVTATNTPIHYDTALRLPDAAVADVAFQNLPPMNAPLSLTASSP